MSWWNGFSGIWLFRLTYDIEINIHFFYNWVPYFIIIALLPRKGDLHLSSMYASLMVLFFISWWFCSLSEFCPIMWYYGYNKYILKIACSCTVCASLANLHPNLSYIIYIDIKLNRPILVGVNDSFTNTVPSSSFWWHPHHLFVPLPFFRKLKP